MSFGELTKTFIMKRSLKKFKLRVYGKANPQVRHYANGIVEVEGRDIWDAYYKACKQHKYVRRPKRRKSSKWVKQHINKLSRRVEGIDARTIKMTPWTKLGWFYTSYGVKKFD